MAVKDFFVRLTVKAENEFGTEFMSTRLPLMQTPDKLIIELVISNLSFISIHL